MNRPAKNGSATPRGAGLTLAVLGLATAAAFWPALDGAFLNWDDGANFLENLNFRGLGWTQLSWMWTTFHMGHYQPLSWMSLGLDYLVWGMDPRGYHLTSLALHAVNAALFYFVARAVLTRSLGRASSLGALFAALVFAVHPLRVESVAWITERRDVLSGAFYLAAVLFYLKAEGYPRGRSRRLNAALACYLLSLLSKGIGVSLPLALLILDAYPLGRLRPGPAPWRDPEARAVLMEKLPFFAAALPFGLIAVLAQKHTGVLAHFASVSALQRLGLALFGAAFYIGKTVAPVRLLPLYTRPTDFALWSRWVCLSAGATLAISFAVLGLRRRCPGLLAAWAYYLITVLPVLGFVLSGIYTAADRYTYLACLPWAVLAGAAAESAWQSSAGAAAKTALLMGLCVPVAALGALTRQQARVWHDSATLWRYTLSVAPRCAPAHNNLGTALARAGREQEAAAEFQSAVEIDPVYAEAHNNLGTALVHAGRLEEAVGQYRQALKADPAYAMARDNLGAALAGEGRIGEAIVEYRQALKVNPDDAHAHNNLGQALAGEGKLDEAMAEYRQALRLSPHYAQAASNLRALSNER